MGEIKHRVNARSVILSLLNGLKHTPQTIGPVLGVDPEKLERVVRGEDPLTKEMEEKLIMVTGINQRDFYLPEFQHFFPVIDDTDDGVVIFRREDMEKSQRTISRGPENIPYYIYGDTAMSNLSTFRPEWIKQLYVNDGENTDSLPDWAFNKGHLEHQVTYFIGPVNFHWKDKEGKKYVCQMNTGDTNYIVPFVPHSFTTRVKGEGLILAVTYGGAVADSEFRSNLSVLDLEEYLRNVSERLPILSPEAVKEIKNGVAINSISPCCQRDTKIRELAVSGGRYIGVRRENVFSDRWGYNIGGSSIILRWGLKNEGLLGSGDSFFIRPETPHVFVGTTAGQGKLLVVDIRPQQGDPYTELALIGKYAGEEGLKRVHTETTRWY